MRISEYIIKIVGQRKIPENRQGAVVMKLDVEGREMSIVGQYSYKVDIIIWEGLKNGRESETMTSLLIA